LFVVKIILVEKESFVPFRGHHVQAVTESEQACSPVTYISIWIQR